MESKMKSLEQNQTNTVMALLSVQTAIKLLLSLKALLFGKHSLLSVGMLKQFELESHIHLMSLLCQYNFVQLHMCYSRRAKTTTGGPASAGAAGRARRASAHIACVGAARRANVQPK